MHITNLSNVLFFSEKNKVFKKKNKTFSLKEQELFKIWPVVFSITASTCRTALLFFQIFQPFRKRPARRHSGWRICIVKCFSRKISFRKTIPQKSEEYQLGWNIPTPAEGFLNPILQPECPRVGRLRAGWSFWRIFQGIPYRAWRMTIFHWKKVRYLRKKSKICSQAK